MINVVKGQICAEKTVHNYSLTIRPIDLYLVVMYLGMGCSACVTTDVIESKRSEVK